MIAAEWEPINIIQHGERDVMYYIPSQIGRERTDIVQQLIFCRPRNPNIIKCGLTTDQTHANHCPNAASMLAQYIQYWASIETALIQRPVLTEGTYTLPRWSREIFAPMVMAIFLCKAGYSWGRRPTLLKQGWIRLLEWGLSKNIFSAWPKFDLSHECCFNVGPLSTTPALH